MTRLFEEAVATVSALPDEQQDELARVLLQLAGVEQPPYDLTPEEEADLDASIAEAERGEFATDKDIRAIWAKHGR
jgi:predicted transcriptional regulator